MPAQAHPHIRLGSKPQQYRATHLALQGTTSQPHLSSTHCPTHPPTWHYDTQREADQEVEGAHVVWVPVKVDLRQLGGKLEDEAVPQGLHRTGVYVVFLVNSALYSEYRDLCFTMGTEVYNGYRGALAQTGR
jgi:hypothetical protein